MKWDDSDNGDAEQDHNEKLDRFLEELSEQPEYEELVSEIGVLRSIYGDDSVRVRNKSSPEASPRRTSPGKFIRYEVHLDLPPPHDSSETRFRVLVSLPSAYPESPPQLQLLSRYIGSFGVDPELFGSVLRTYISSNNGVEFIPGAVCVFDGLEKVKEQCLNWYEERLSEEKVKDLLKEDERGDTHGSASQTVMTANVARNQEKLDTDETQATKIPDGLVLSVAEPIVDRKSVFVGRACRITDPSQVKIILDHLLSDRRIARAAHPIINAWRCKAENGVLYQDNDDDGETAAGGRLAHLLQILEIDNILVIVTRYFGGIHLGPDRFRHINQAARNALELGGFLDTPHKEKPSRSRKK